MRENKSVEHKGVVERVDGKVVRVGFVAHSACSACHAKGACSLSDVESKYVEVLDTEGSYSIGDKVDITLQQQQGFKALWFGYVLPFLVMLITLIIVVSATGREGLAGLFAVGVLIPYYLTLYIFRARIKEKFEFKIRKTV